MKIKTILTLMLSVLLCWSCSQDAHEADPSLAGTAGKLAVSLPGINTARTYALSNGDQNTVETTIDKLSVYLFDETVSTLSYIVPAESFGSANALFALEAGMVGKTFTAVFVANTDLASASTGMTYDSFKALTTDVITDNLQAPFVMFAEKTGLTIASLDVTTTATISLSRLAARIDITNKVGDVVVINSAKILNAATSSPVSPLGTASGVFGNFGAVTNEGYNTTTGNLGTDMSLMWSQLYAYANDNIATPTQLEITYTWAGVVKTQTVDFLKTDGSVLAIDRNHRYEITITDGTINGLEFSVSVKDWEMVTNIDADISGTALVVTIPSLGSDASFANNTFSVPTGAGISINLDYTSPTALDAPVVTGSGDLSWISAAKSSASAYTTYAATGGFTGSVIIGLSSNDTQSSRSATVTIGNSRFKKTYIVTQDPGNAITANMTSANMYIVAPSGQAIVFDAARANADGVTRIGANDKIVVKFIWTDNANGLANNGVISGLSTFGKGSSTLIRVAPGTGKGNAVIAAYNFTTGKIVWSWHIWNTDYDPATTNKTYTSTGTTGITTPDAGKTLTFMDRNLGAFNATAGDVGSQGLLYQWGRKDPFIGKGSWVNTTIENPIYNANGAAFEVTKIRSDATPNGGNPNNLEFTIQNPTSFIYGIATTNIGYDWYTTDDNRTSQKDDLWGYNGTATITKSVYDPCPEGWRLPHNGAWTGLSATVANVREFSWNAAEFGRTGVGASAQIGYYPAAGNRNSNNGNFANLGLTGYYWSATNTGAAGYYLSFTNSSITTSSGSNRSNGFGVRCVKE